MLHDYWTFKQTCVRLFKTPRKPQNELLSGKKDKKGQLELESTHEVWMKSLVKDYVVSEEVLTPHNENLGGIWLYNQEVNVLRYVSLKPS